MLSLRAHAWITAALIAAIVVFSIVGNVLHDQGILKDGSGVQSVAKYIFFGLFLAFGYSAIPLMVKLVLAGQAKIGNADVALVRTAQANETRLIIGFWALITAGLALAIPAAIKDGMFDTDPAGIIAATPSRGMLVAAPGLTVADMQRLSSLPVKGSANSAFADGNLFDFSVAGTGISFPRCRYYYITTFSNDHGRIENISVGTAQSKMTKVQLAGADADLRDRLAADGWLTGYEKTRSEQDRRFHGGAAGRASGAIWLKGETVLRILSRRLDEVKAGESADAGEWIQFVELSGRTNYAGLERYEFAKP